MCTGNSLKHENSKGKTCGYIYVILDNGEKGGEGILDFKSEKQALSPHAAEESGKQSSYWANSETMGSGEI